MESNTTSHLRAWLASIETTMGIIIGADERGAFALRTQAGKEIAVEPVADVQALIFSGLVGTVDDTTSASLLKALLAANFLILAPSVVSLQTTEGLIVLRLIWDPVEAHWHEEAFIEALTDFSRQVDAVAESITTGSLETLLPPLNQVITEPAPQAGLQLV